MIRPLVLALFAALLAGFSFSAAAGADEFAYAGAPENVTIRLWLADAPGRVTHGLLFGAAYVAAPASSLARGDAFQVEMPDGVILAARLIDRDPTTGVALLETDRASPHLEEDWRADVGAPTCAHYRGAGGVQTRVCGTVTAAFASGRGLHAIEDFVTVAFDGPPPPAGAILVDGEQRLLGMMAGDGESAYSAHLMTAVTTPMANGEPVRLPTAGWRLAPARYDGAPAVRIEDVDLMGLAAWSGLLPGDRVVQFGGRPLDDPRTLDHTIAILRPGQDGFQALIRRDDWFFRTTVWARERDRRAPDARDQPDAGPTAPPCLAPAPVCAQTGAVFSINAAGRIVSATRIGSDLLVASRWDIADSDEALVHLGTRYGRARVIPSAFSGGLTLMSSPDLPLQGPIMSVAEEGDVEELWVIATDRAQRGVRASAQAGVVTPAIAGAALSRLQTHGPPRRQAARGGAIVDGRGRLAGVVVSAPARIGFKEPRLTSLPPAGLRELLAARNAPGAAARHRRAVDGVVACNEALTDIIQPGVAESPEGPAMADRVYDVCATLDDLKLLGQAAESAARMELEDRALELYDRIFELAPQDIDRRLSYAETLERFERFEEMAEQVRWLVTASPGDPRVRGAQLRAGAYIQDREMAEAAFAAILEQRGPERAAHTRAFIDRQFAAPKPGSKN